MSTITIERAEWLADKLHNGGDYGKEAAGVLVQQAKMIEALRAALAQQAEPDLSRCPQCNGPADNGFDRSFPPSPYLCKKCMAEPVEPVAWMFESERNFNLVGYGGWEKRITECRPNALQSSVRNVTALYAAPPQRDALLQALQTLMHVCQRMDLEHQAERPSEAEYQTAMQAAQAAIQAVVGGA